jgi:quinol monooxygenase YgiN
MTDLNAAQAPDAFVVIAEFVIKEACMDSFLTHAFDDARHSVADEAGCLQFDVLRTGEGTNGVVFYEVYTSRQAFDEHLKTPHVARFRAILSDHVEAERPVRFLGRL